MLVFNVTFKCRPGMRDTFLEQIMSAGNLRYDYSVPVDHADELFLVEKYRDAGAVAEHVRQTHTAKLVELKEQYVSDMILEQYEAPEASL